MYETISTAKPIRPGQHPGGQPAQSIGIRGGGGVIPGNGPAAVKEFA